MYTVIYKVFIRNVSLRFYVKSKFCVCFEVHIPVKLFHKLTTVFTRLDLIGKVQKQSVLLFMYTAGMVLAGLKYSIFAFSRQLQVVDLLYFWQLIYVRVNEAMCSSILFNLPGFQLYFKCLLTLLKMSKSGRIT